MPNTPEIHPEKTVKDTRIPIPQAANRIVDAAKMNLADQQALLRDIIKGGLSDAEIYRRIALITDLSHEAVKLLSEAQAVGKSAAEKEQQ